MADKETENWAQKSKLIEAERVKAAEALREDEAKGAERENMAYLDPRTMKAKGWSRDPNVILASMEKMGNRALALAVLGVVLGVIGDVGGVVGSLNKLGMGTVMISGLPSGIGLVCIGLAVLMALIALGGEMYYKIKKGRKFSNVLWTAAGALIVVGLYYVVKMIII